jgi:hypothetical protein
MNYLPIRKNFRTPKRALGYSDIEFLSPKSYCGAQLGVKKNNAISQ